MRVEKLQARRRIRLHREAEVSQGAELGRRLNILE